MSKKIEILNQKISEAHLGDGQVRIDKQHKKGKLTARERIHFCWTKIKAPNHEI